MAEKGAHISATYLKKPSIFELIAQESLADTFYPALRRVVLYLSSENPARYGWLTRWYEECFLVFNFVLQYHYLKNYGATFSETFYSLQRVVTKNPQSSNFRLPPRHELISLVCVTLYPYLRHVLRQAANKFQEEETFDDDQDSERWKKELIIILHRSSHIILETCSFILYLRYMTGRSEQHSMLLRLAGVTLVYQTEENEELICWKTLWNYIRSGNVRSVLAYSPLKYIFSCSLEVCAFFIQFLNWWHTEQLSKINSYPVPPAPDVKTDMTKGICPVCSRRIEMETALSVSGYVFCFKCIKSKLIEKKRCPVTNLAANMGNLIRLYPGVYS